jgi:D-alanyl-D-alanine carboxypeptidase
MRKPIINFIGIIITVTILSIGCTKNEFTDSNDSTSNYKKVFRVVDSLRQALQTTSGKIIPSLNVFITTPTEEIFVSSVPRNGVRLTRDTYFRFASNTKNMTATAILNMQEDGWLNISDKITDKIPGSNITYVPNTTAWNIPYKNQITIRQLLQHSAGVYDLVNDTVPGCGGKSYTMYIEELDPNHQYTAGEFANQLGVKKLSNFPPGTNWSYSNTGYALLAEIIGRVYSFKKGVAKVYTDYMNDFLMSSSAPVPLGIRFPYLATDQQMPAPSISSTAYMENGSTTTYSNCNMSANVSEGNGVGTMSMLNRYLRSLMTGSNVLKPASVNLMKTDISPGSTTYALGCAYQVNLGYGHTGSTHGYLSAMFYDPLTGVSVIAMLPVWDFSNGMASYNYANIEMIRACYLARMVLGYPGY